jgi:hypothetical protein
VIIVQHPRERFHPLGTARIAELGLLRCRVVRPSHPVSHSLSLADWAPAGAALLFPGISGHTPVDTRDLADLPPGDQPSALVVLDGTWPQARALYRQNPWLRALPHVRLEPSRPSRYRIRRPPRFSYLSTIEAVVAALGFIEPETTGTDSLLAVFDAMIDEQAAFAGRAPRRPERKIARRARGRASARTP